MVELESVKIEDIFSSKGRMKVIKILASEGELNISEIGRRAKLSHTSVQNHTNFLTSINILQEKVFGRIKIYKFRNEITRNKAIKGLIDIWENNLTPESVSLMEESMKH